MVARYDQEATALHIPRDRQGQRPDGVPGRHAGLDRAAGGPAGRRTSRRSPRSSSTGFTQNLPLGSDATLYYVLGPNHGPLTPADLQSTSPYNTRSRPGLPPTPINSPGQAALEAVLHHPTGPLTVLRDDRQGRPHRVRHHAEPVQPARRAVAGQRRLVTRARGGAAVLGSPIAHSLSPVLHRAAYDALGLTDWGYHAVECTADALPRAAARARGRRAWPGSSLTMPLKRAVVPLLARMRPRGGADRGRQHGAVRRRRRATGGGPTPTSTGSSPSLRGAGVGLDPEDRGLRDRRRGDRGLGDRRAGGARGSRGRRRRPAGRSAAGTLVRRRCGARRGRSRSSDWPPLPGCTSAALVVSTAPAGATDELAVGLGPVDGVLLDVVYAPWPTPLAAAWQRGGRAR